MLHTFKQSPNKATLKHCYAQKKNLLDRLNRSLDIDEGKNKINLKTKQ